jgi:hypothetical protein
MCTKENRCRYDRGKPRFPSDESLQFQQGCRFRGDPYQDQGAEMCAKFKRSAIILDGAE